MKILTYVHTNSKEFTFFAQCSQVRSFSDARECIKLRDSLLQARHSARYRLIQGTADRGPPHARLSARTARLPHLLIEMPKPRNYCAVEVKKNFLMITY